MIASWLQCDAVRFVARRDATLDRAGRDEARRTATHPCNFHRVWAWPLTRLRGPPPVPLH